MRGDSMAPTLRDRDLLITRSIRKGELAAAGDIVVLRAGSNFIVKRVHESNHDSIILASDSDSEDSTYCYRPLSRNRVVGKVLVNF